MSDGTEIVEGKQLPNDVLQTIDSYGKGRPYAGRVNAELAQAGDGMPSVVRIAYYENGGVSITYPNTAGQSVMLEGLKKGLDVLDYYGGSINVDVIVLGSDNYAISIGQ